MDVDQRVAYMQRILRGSALKKYKAFLSEWNQSEKDLVGNKWTLVKLKGISTDDFWTWDKIERLYYDGDSYLGLEKWLDFEKDIWFELGKYMWRKHRSVLQDHLKYISNGIVKSFCVVILRYGKRVQDMHDLSKQLPPPFDEGWWLWTK